MLKDHSFCAHGFCEDVVGRASKSPKTDVAFLFYGEISRGRLAIDVAFNAVRSWVLN